jgi:hypothetical protein
MAVLAVTATLWLFSGLVRRWQARPSGEGDPAAPPRAS